ncbi:RluA family pseudouridine synthase [Neokomagataea anthophila]|uniref:RNA pseudouridine synthase n=1 Tax=Neokomagataea anthophila TaxID=2826925 RepID=A0ABS5E9W3_9PROT|nr:RNA pseudouridine synthase [Neokomagataea anthophila]MBR0560676.1 RNA pseudouridine synthase [Neokomagataea anthophila]
MKTKHPSLTGLKKSPALFRAGQDLPLLYTSPHYLIINKPSGLAVHPGPRTSDSVETRLVPHPRGGPWLVHRLDRDTSGCLLIARRKTALIAAQNAFTQRHVQKTYWAIVNGLPPGEKGIITAPLKKHTTPEGWRMVSDPKGEYAETHWRLLTHQNGKSLLELNLKTGRTHQARIHCAILGTSILGDNLYGHPHTHGLHLLARGLTITLAEENLKATAPPPKHFLEDFDYTAQF